MSASRQEQAVVAAGYSLATPMWHMPSGNMLTRGFAVLLLIIEEYTRPECLQKFTFVFASKK